MAVHGMFTLVAASRAIPGPRVLRLEGPHSVSVSIESLKGVDVGNSFVLEVSGTFTAGVGVDYSAVDGKAQTDVDLPWRHETQPTPEGMLYLNAVHFGSDTGELTCRIIRDGQVVAAMTNNGTPNAISRVNCHVTAIVQADGTVQSTST